MGGRERGMEGGREQREEGRWERWSGGKGYKDSPYISVHVHVPSVY